jgi:excisionase family DNA binding protein
MLTIPEAAKYLGISTRHIRNLIADSTLTGYRIGDTGNIRSASTKSKPPSNPYTSTTGKPGDHLRGRPRRPRRHLLPLPHG